MEKDYIEVIKDLWKGFNKVQRAKYILLFLILIPHLPFSALQTVLDKYFDWFEKDFCADFYWRWIGYDRN